MSVDSAALDMDRLNEAERAFLAGVFAYQHIHRAPTEAEFRSALDVMSSYSMKCQDTPPTNNSSSQHTYGAHCLSDRERLMTAAVAFMRFGVTRPMSTNGPLRREIYLGQCYESYALIRILRRIQGSSTSCEQSECVQSR